MEHFTPSRGLIAQRHAWRKIYHSRKMSHGHRLKNEELEAIRKSDDPVEELARKHGTTIRKIQRIKQTSDYHEHSD